MIRLELPWPPSVNALWRAVAGRVILSSSARKYHKAAAAALPPGRVATLRGPLAVFMRLDPPEKLARGGQRWDIANREKIVCDLLTAQRVWEDDSQIDLLVIQRGTPHGPGRAVLDIVPLDGVPAIL